MPQSLTIPTLRRYAAARSFFHQPTLLQAIEHLGYVQADPMQAPARAQDLILRHRVTGYRVGDLDVAYPHLPIEEDFLINYGYVPRKVYAQMQPRMAQHEWSAAQKRLASELHAHVRDNGPSHPKDVAAAFGNTSIRNYWGGKSTASTHMLDGMHYRSMLRVSRREKGIRIYEVARSSTLETSPQERVRELMNVVFRQYAPLTERGLRGIARHLRGGVPQFVDHIRAEVTRLIHILPSAQIDGQRWLWPEGESPGLAEPPTGVRILAPFDPVVWDRNRFELFQGWGYRFEAYTPAPQRKLGHYALPLLVGDQVLGWVNATVGRRSAQASLHAEIGFVRPMGSFASLQRDTEAELWRFAVFLGLPSSAALTISRHRNSAW